MDEFMIQVVIGYFILYTGYLIVGLWVVDMILDYLRYRITNMQVESVESVRITKHECNN